MPSAAGSLAGPECTLCSLSLPMTVSSVAKQVLQLHTVITSRLVSGEGRCLAPRMQE